MAKVIWSVLCRKGILDQFSNQISLIDVVEAIEMTVLPEPVEVQGGQLPKMIFGMMLVTLLQRTDPNVTESPLCRVQIVSPDGSKQAGPEADLDLETSGRTRYFANIPSLPQTGPGIFKFNFQEKIKSKSGRGRWKTIGTSFLEVTVKFAEPSSTEPEPPS